MGWLTKHTPDLRGKAPLVGLDLGYAPGRTYLDIAPFGVNTGRSNTAGLLSPESGYEHFAQHGYARNELVWACITKKAAELPQATLRVYPDPQGEGEAVEDHRLRRLLEEPNPVTNEHEFWAMQVVYKDLGGATFTLIERARDGGPGNLWPLRPDLIRVEPSPSDPNVWRWLYCPDPNDLEWMIPVAQEDMIRVRYPHPTDPYFGQAPLRPAARATSLDNAATEYVNDLLRNSAVPGIVIEAQEAVDEEIADRLKRRWIRAFGGRKRGEPAVLQSGVKLHTVGMDLKQLEFPDLRTISESRICMALHVPPIIVGAKVGLDRSTFANYGEARTSLWEETIMPDQDEYLAAFRKRLLTGPVVGVGRRRVYLRWDNSGVMALRESEAARWERATNALRAGGMTVADFRRIVGLPPVPETDYFLTPAGVAPTRRGETPAAPAPPPAVPAAPEPSRNGSSSPADTAAKYALSVLQGGQP
jgi:HK97 family phage portal protein